MSREETLDGQVLVELGPTDADPAADEAVLVAGLG